MNRLKAVVVRLKITPAVIAFTAPYYGILVEATAGDFNYLNGWIFSRAIAAISRAGTRKNE